MPGGKTPSVSVKHYVAEQLFAMAQIYHEILSRVIRAPIGFVDYELNGDYLWVIQHIHQLLENEAVADFPGGFEPLVPNILPSSLPDVDWEFCGQMVEDFVSRVQQYLMACPAPPQGAEKACDDMLGKLGEICQGIGRRLGRYELEVRTQWAEIVKRLKAKADAMHTGEVSGGKGAAAGTPEEPSCDGAAPAISNEGGEPMPDPSDPSEDAYQGQLSEFVEDLAKHEQEEAQQLEEEWTNDPAWQAIHEDPEYAKLEAEHNRIAEEYEVKRQRWQGKMFRELPGKEQQERLQLIHEREKALEPILRKQAALREKHGLAEQDTDDPKKLLDWIKGRLNILDMAQAAGIESRIAWAEQFVCAARERALHLRARRPDLPVLPPRVPRPDDALGDVREWCTKAAFVWTPPASDGGPASAMAAMLRAVRFKADELERLQQEFAFASEGYEGFTTGSRATKWNGPWKQTLRDAPKPPPSVGLRFATMYYQRRADEARHELMHMATAVADQADAGLVEYVRPFKGDEAAQRAAGLRGMLNRVHGAVATGSVNTDSPDAPDRLSAWPTRFMDEETFLNDIPRAVGAPSIAPQEPAETQPQEPMHKPKPPPSQDEEDVPDEEGFVKNPKDKSAYFGASQIIKNHWPVPPLRSVSNKNKELGKILDDHPEIWRWRPQPQDKKRFRLGVHLGRWEAYLEAEKKRLDDSLSAVAKQMHWICRNCKTVFVDRPAEDRCPTCRSDDVTPVVPRVPR